MARNFNYYAAVGDNGYALSPDWADIVSAAKQLTNEWHRGFQTEEDAYDYIQDQMMLKRSMKSLQVCDLNTLRMQKIVILDSVSDRASTPRRASVQPVMQRTYNSLAECLAADDEEDEKAEPRSAALKKDIKNMVKELFNEMVKEYQNTSK